jgi:flavin reductase
MTVDRAAFRDALARLGAAVNIITTDGPAGAYGMTASAVCSVTDDPPTILVCVNRASEANRSLKANGVFCVNVLAGRHRALADRFSTKGVTIAERFSDRDAWHSLATGSPALRDASISIDCQIGAVSEVGSHSIFFGDVVGLNGHDGYECLVYFDRKYHALAREKADLAPGDHQAG